MPALIAVGAISGIASIGSAISGHKDQKAMLREMKRQRQLAEQQLAFAKQQWTHYTDTYGGLEQLMVADATQGVQGDYNGVTGRAATDVATQFNNQRDAQDRQMQAYGLDPSSGRFASTDRTSRNQEALASALNQNMARNNERQYADNATRAMRTQVGMFGAGQINGAANRMDAANNTLMALSGQRAAALGGMAQSAYGTAGQLAGLSAGTFMNKFSPTFPQNTAMKDNVFAQSAMKTFNQPIGFNVGNQAISDPYASNLSSNLSGGARGLQLNYFN